MAVWIREVPSYFDPNICPGRTKRLGARTTLCSRRAIALVAAFLLCVFTSSPAAADAPPTAAPPSEERDLSKPIIMGVNARTFPYSFMDKEGKLRGFAVDLADAIARVMGLRLEKRMYEMDSELLVSRKVDMLPLMAETEPRRQVLEFSVPILRMESVVVVRRGDPRIRHLSDLAGKRVAVGVHGSVGHEYLKHEQPRAIVDFTVTHFALPKLVNGTLDAIVLSRLTAISEIERLGLNSSLEILTDHVIGYDVRRSIAVRRGDALLLARINEGLAILYRTGEYEQIRSRWFGQYEDRTFTWLELSAYLAGLMALAGGVVLMVLSRQRKLATRLVRQDDELAEQRSLLSALYDNHPLATWVLAGMPGDTPRLLSWNSQAATLLGLANDAQAGQTFDQLSLAPETRPLLDEVVARWQEGLPCTPWETNLPTTHRILESSMVSLGLSSSGASRICVLTGDVTLRRLADQTVAQSRRLQALGEMVGGIAHEFNNLLTPVTATVDFMRRSYQAVDGLGEDLQLIDDAARQAAELTRRLLSFGRKSDSNTRAVQIAEIATNCLALLRPACDRRIEWVSQVPDDLRALELNPTDLNQILLNLLINARDTLQAKLVDHHTEDWIPRIVIRAEELSSNSFSPRPEDAHRNLLGWQVLTVQDNGSGIPADIRDRIFEPFFTTKEVGKGTGIGLATVWHLVTDAGGSISVHSQLGEGTEFQVVLPRWWNQPTIHSSVRPPAEFGGGQRLHVFLVEDERLLARACVRGLVGLGHQVTHAVDGLEAWLSFEKGAGQAHDVLLTDVSMPRMDGIDLVRRVRKLGFRGRVILMSGRVDSIGQDVIETLAVDYVLAKPFTTEQLLTAVGQIGRKGSKTGAQTPTGTEHGPFVQ